MSEKSPAPSRFACSFAHAFRGVAIGLRSQRNLRIHALATFLVIGLGFLLDIAAWEWCALIMTCGAVWAAELLNTAIERLADRVTSEREEIIRNVKDTAAGAVLMMSLAAVGVSVVIFLPRLLRL